MCNRECHIIKVDHFNPEVRETVLGVTQVQYRHQISGYEVEIYKNEDNYKEHVEDFVKTELVSGLRDYVKVEVSETRFPENTINITAKMDLPSIDYKRGKELDQRVSYLTTELSRESKENRYLSSNLKDLKEQLAKIDLGYINLNWFQKLIVKKWW